MLQLLPRNQSNHLSPTPRPIFPLLQLQSNRLRPIFPPTPTLHTHVTSNTSPSSKCKPTVIHYPRNYKTSSRLGSRSLLRRHTVSSRSFFTSKLKQSKARTQLRQHCARKHCSNRHSSSKSSSNQFLVLAMVKVESQYQTWTLPLPPKLNLLPPPHLCPSLHSQRQVQQLPLRYRTAYLPSWRE